MINLLVRRARPSQSTFLRLKEFGNEQLNKLLELDGGVLVDTPAVARNLHAPADVRQLLEMEIRSHETAFNRVR